MKEILFNWLHALGLDVTPLIGTIAVLALILVIALAVHLLLHYVALPALKQRVLFQHHLFARLSFILQGVILSVQARIWLEQGTMVRAVLELIANLWILLFSLLSLFALLDAVEQFADKSERVRKLPLRGFFQGIKLVASILAVILGISILIGKSPMILISGLGAMTAVLMLVFKDPIMGLVAGIQLSANNMLAVGDWLEMPKYGADGDVIDISLTTVKVRNWDRTITTIPTYALISDSFKNWRGMQESGGRRIMRSVFIDATSVHFLTDDETKRLRKAQLLSQYIEDKLKEIQAHNKTNNIDPASPVNGRRLTNLGTFRAYLSQYLKAHPRVHPGMIQMVRQLASGPNGIPMEVYAFASTTAWVEYEGIQADIFDHIFAVLPEFGLRVYQNPTGHDMLMIGSRSARGVQAEA